VSDLKTFDRTFGLPDPPSFKKVNQTGGTSYPQADAGWAGEIALDVEWAHAIAPGANILLVEANSSSPVDVFTAIDYARNQPGVVAVSLSLGGPEQGFNVRVADTFLTTPAGHIGGYGMPGGITFVASTGDDGAPGGYPAYSPNVLAVGGTSLYVDNQGNYDSEAGWSGSGGISQVEPEPDYQRSVQNTGARTIPDVAYNADPNTGVWVYDSLAGGWETVGGTSAGAPQWAGLIALADQAREEILGVGSLDGPTETLPAIYSPIMSYDFNDVTFGSNGYAAGYGYDLVTGLGSPYAYWVVSDLCLAGYENMGQPPAAKSAAVNTFSDDLAPVLAAEPVQSMPATKLAVDSFFADPHSGLATPIKREETLMSERSLLGTDLQPTRHLHDAQPDANSGFLKSELKSEMASMKL